MTTPDIDFMAFFTASLSPYLVLDTDLVIRAANDAYLQATGRTREELIGRYLFDAFPENPAIPAAHRGRFKASLEDVAATGRSDAVVLRRYDMPVAGRPGEFEERWWSATRTPVVAPDGSVRWIVQRIEDVTAFVHARRGSPAGRQLTGRQEAMEAELYARSRELQRLNEELRHVHARERQVALTLQEAMLRSPELPRHHDIAVRYLPAIGTLNVCGDWYLMVDLPPDRLVIAVGDVVGHGLEAAAVMGMLRSALNAAVRAVPSPAQALEVLGLYARSMEGALGATLAEVLVERRSRLLIYSVVGHPPPVLVHRDGRCELLDQATDPPLGVRSEHVPRPQAGLPYTPGDTLVLYTDGLIERRGEDIDVGLTRLTDALAQYRALGIEELADALLGALNVASGTRDDIALVIVRL